MSKILKKTTTKKEKQVTTNFLFSDVPQQSIGLKSYKFCLVFEQQILHQIFPFLQLS